MKGWSRAANQRPEARSTQLVLTLGVAGLLSGLAIVSAYEWTLPRIEANQATALRAAVFRVLPGVSRVQPLLYSRGRLRSAAPGRHQGPLVYAGCDRHGRTMGFAIPGAGPGFQDTIKVLFGYRPDLGLIVGLEILESRETPGLGDRIYKDAAFQKNFRALAVQPPITLVKRGTKRAPNEVDGITGATISSRAVVNILNAEIEKWRLRLPEGRSLGCHQEAILGSLSSKQRGEP